MEALQLLRPGLPLYLWGRFSSCCSHGFNSRFILVKIDTAWQSPFVRGGVSPPDSVVAVLELVLCSICVSKFVSPPAPLARVQGWGSC